MSPALPFFGTGTGPLATALAVLGLLVPVLVYLDAAPPDRSLDAAQRCLSRVTGRHKGH